MKGQANVIAALNALLASELSAMDQYFIHSQMYQDWGLNKLYERIGHELPTDLMAVCSFCHELIHGKHVL